MPSAARFKPVDPDALSKQATYRRAIPKDLDGKAQAPGALPVEAYQYDIVYDCFMNDTRFWQDWGVIAALPNQPHESISCGHAFIRVILKEMPESKLFPTVYTPGVAMLPPEVDAETSEQTVRDIPGLPRGYSVALEVHFLADARIFLKNQKSWLGKVGPKYEWLEKIIKEYDDSQSPQSESTPERPPTLPELEDAAPRKPVGFMPKTVVTGLSDDLKPFSDQYGNSKAGGGCVKLGNEQVQAELSLVDAFGRTTGLPPRSSAWTPSAAEPAAPGMRSLTELDR